MRDFYIGQKVVCIFDKPFVNQRLAAGRPDFDALHGLTKGNIYTIRWVGEVAFPGLSYIGIKVQEIKRDCWEGLNEHSQEMARMIFAPHGEDVPYHADRFAPIIKTDISIFTEMLNPVEELEEVV